MRNKDIGFDGFSKKQIQEIYYDIYSREKELKFGVVAIKLEMIDEIPIPHTGQE